MSSELVSAFRLASPVNPFSFDGRTQYDDYDIDPNRLETYNGTFFVSPSGISQDWRTAIGPFPEIKAEYLKIENKKVFHFL
jgi:hypothetical protein